MRLSSFRPPAVLAALALAAAVLPAVPALAGADSAAPGSFTPAAAPQFRVLPVTPPLVERLAGTTPVPARVGLAARARAQRTSATAVVRSTWQVTYDDGFRADPVARAEFQRAVDTWASLVASRVPITVDAHFEALGPRVLGQAGPGDFVEQVRDDRYATGELAYPVALGNAKAGRDLMPPTSREPGFDIIAKFPNNNSRIYYGQGPVPADKYDFYSTVLHELGHGLGFTTFFDDSNGLGHFGASTAAPYLLDFDKVVALGSGAGSTDLVRMQQDSTTLGRALTSGDLFWRGAKGVAANGGTRPKLYAPDPYQDGSSVAHLDEDTYAPGSANALMTPIGDPGELNAEVGPVVLGMFADIGWSVPAAASSPSASPSTSPSSTPSSATPSTSPTAAPSGSPSSASPSTFPTTSPTATAPAAPVPAGSRFTAVTPRRLLDTRSGLGLGGKAVRLGDGGTVDLAVTGGSTGVPAGATAVVLNVTAVGATRATDVRVYPTPTDTSVPAVSNLNLAPRQTRAGVVTVPVGRDGSVRLRNEDGSVSLLADLAGFYAPDAETAFHPVAPVRLLDTRTRATKKLGPGATLDLTVAGVQGVPASASAVVLNVTGVAPTASTDLAVYPASSSSATPETSNVNLVPGVPVPNLVVVKVGEGGRVRVRNSSGSTAVLVDLSGWYDATAPGGQLFRPVAPVRLFDSRDEADPDLRRLKAGGRGAFRVTSGRNAVPSSATAVLLNVTGVAAAGATDLRVYPYAEGSSFPVVSNLNLGRGSTNANAVVVGVGQQGGVLFRNQSSSVAVVTDLAGYFAP